MIPGWVMETWQPKEMDGIFWQVQISTWNRQSCMVGQATTLYPATIIKASFMAAKGLIKSLETTGTTPSEVVSVQIRFWAAMEMMNSTAMPEQM
ncbi:hypothetical protein BWR17_09685 [Phaeobacter inhibens]|nr:hypothetical protein BWR17_09685 [Phaeobacter inhibens]